MDLDTRIGLHVPAQIEVINTDLGDVFSRSRSEGFGREVQKRILLGTYALTAESVPCLSVVRPF